jgi:hypothetical protein
MLKIHRGDAPPDARAPALKPKLRSWTGRVWRWDPQGYQLMLKLDASISLADIEDNELRAALSPFASELSSFELYLDHGAENRLPLPWAVGAFNVERGNKTFARFYDFLETPPANVLLNLLPLAGASSDLIFGVVPYSVETNRLLFAIRDYDLGFHNRIG